MYTCVYWDVDDWCPCDDIHPGIIYGRIISALGFPSETIIRAYVDPNRIPDELLRKYQDEFMVIVEEKNSARFNMMVVDMILWALNTRRPSNFIVITKISEHTEYLIRVLHSLKERGSNVFLALPDTSVPNDLTISVSHRSHRGRNINFLQLPDHTEIRLRICPNLFEKKSYLEAYADYEDESSEYTEDKEEAYWEACAEGKEEAHEVDKEESFSHEEDKEESFSQVIPKAITFSMDSSESGDSKTGIFWDVMDYPLPADLDSSLFYENIKSFLEKKGFLGDLFIWAYVPDDDSLLPPNCRDLDNRFTLVPKVPGDKYARLNKMTVDLLLWAMDNPVHYGRPNLMVISKNMELETRFYPLLRGLKSRGYIVFLALPDPDADKEENNIVTSILPWKSLLSRA